MPPSWSESAPSDGSDAPIVPFAKRFSYVIEAVPAGVRCAIVLN